MNNDILILVHPGAACGLANVQNKTKADAERDGMCRELAEWKGGILVIDNENSEDISAYPKLNTAIRNAVDGATRRGSPAARIFASAKISKDWTGLISKAIRAWGPKPDTYFEVTGAWYYLRTNEGAVNVVYDLILLMGYQGNISSYAVAAD